MQTRFNLIAAAILAIAGLCSTISSHHIISVFFYTIGTILILAAFLSKDKKDKQIEEIHSEITNRNQNKPTETSTPIIESYMGTAHKVEAEAYKNGVIALNRNLASRGLYSSGMAVMQVKVLKLSHIKSFVENCLEYVESTKNNYLLDKPSIKLLFENYQTNDITEFTEIINSQYTARGLNIRQNIMPGITSEIKNAYSIALLRIDAM